MEAFFRRRSDHATQSMKAALCGGRLADNNCPPGCASLSKTSTLCPRAEAAMAADKPAGPAPTTHTRLGGSALGACSLYSRPHSGLKLQVADFISKLRRSMQP